MSSNNGYIYVRTHKSYDIDNVCKLGKTINFVNRDKNYITSEFIKGEFILIIEILNNQIYDDTFTEKILQNHFKNYHKKRNGGSEFYDKQIIDEIIPFLELTNIKFKVLEKEEIDQIYFNSKINNLKKLIKLKHINNIKNKIKNNKKEMLNKHLLFKYENKDTILRDQLQEIYIIDIIEKNHNYHYLLFFGNNDEDIENCMNDRKNI